MRTTLIESNGFASHQINLLGGDQPQQPPRMQLATSAWLAQTFLPADYPASCAADYAEYQVYDSLQALCSSLCGAMATGAVLRAIGVGSTEASVASATVHYLLRDAVAIVARIAFSSLNGTAIDSEPKRFRLLADALNDVALLLDMAAPQLLPRQWLVLAMCASAVARALVGVAGGCSKAAISQHQARRANIADLLAKDAAQENVVNLIGVLLSVALTRALTLLGEPPLLVWCVFLSLVALHMLCNYRAVNCVVFETLNAPRLAMLMDEFAAARDAPLSSPAQVARRELFVRKFVDRAASKPVRLGASARHLPRAALQIVLQRLEAGEKFCVLASKQTVDVHLRADCQPIDLLDAFIAARAQSIQCATKLFAGDAFKKALTSAGWKLKGSTIVASATRLHVAQKEQSKKQK